MNAFVFLSVILLFFSFGFLGAHGSVSIPSHNGYIHMIADTPDKIISFNTPYAAPSILLPQDILARVRSQSNQTITFEIRFKMFDVEGLPQLFIAPSGQLPASGYSFQSPILYYIDSRIHFVFYDAEPPAVSNILNIADGEWHMLTAVFFNSSVLIQSGYFIYVDGTPVLSASRPIYYYINGNLPFTLLGGGGCKHDLNDWPNFPDGIKACYFNGYFDEFRMWSKALTQPQIQANMNRSLFGDEDGLAYLLTFDEAKYESLTTVFEGSGAFPDISTILSRDPYRQNATFIPSNIVVDLFVIELNETHFETTIVFNNTGTEDELHPFGPNNFFLINNTTRMDMDQPKHFAAGSTTPFRIVWTNATLPPVFRFAGNAYSVDEPTTEPPPIPSPISPPVDPVIDTPQPIGQDTPSNDNTTAIAVGVTIPVVVVAVAAVLLAVFLVRRKKKADKEKTFADKQGAIIQSRKVQIQNKIGSGSFGDVWKGIWRGKEVAVKEVKSGADSSFLNEIKIMAKLPPHENVMEVYGAIIDADSPSLVLEYCGGGSLDFLLYDSEEPISETKMFKLALGIARGMEHLHKYNIVHRDLAARNILLKDHIPKICDFGMSRTVTERNMSNKTKNDIGPIRWMAPEALLQEYSTKTDIWSYGIVLSELVSRQEPHTDVDPLKVALMIRDEKATPKIPADCPPVLADIMKMCWNPDPNERPEFTKIVELLEMDR